MGGSLDKYSRARPVKEVLQFQHIWDDSVRSRLREGGVKSSLHLREVAKDDRKNCTDECKECLEHLSARRATQSTMRVSC